MSAVKPLYKKGDNTSMTNYRPMSSLTGFCKVLERPMHSRLNQHLHTNILVTEWYGCRKGTSIEDGDFRIMSSSLFFSINPIIDIYHEDVEMATKQSIP